MPAQVTPEDRACIQFALFVTMGLGPEDDIIVARDGQHYFWESELVKLEPSGSPQDAVVVTLAQVMKLHLHGFGFAELRDDLVRSGVGEQFAKRVHDHLESVSVEEWERLRERIVWYGDDNVAPIIGSTKVTGES
ncbi:hypothetical protein [Ruegeria atlantica]|uniref:hypothetical protein n=1 Tax=Ruegeria atlantica TaxID=81569 RepID=UPI001479A3C3|nr:hypothetical protein [Ruegeria atlantica]